MKWPLMAGAALYASFADVTVQAADISVPLKAPIYSHDDAWSGAYFGGHIGYGRGTAHATLTETISFPLSQAFGSLYGGVQAGYNQLLRSGLLLGAEADVSFPNAAPSDNVVWMGAVPAGSVVERIDYLATLRARLGFGWSNVLPYLTGGFAWSNGHAAQQPFASDTEDSHLHRRIGGAAGVGIEVGFARTWSARVEYLYTRLGRLHAAFWPGTEYSSTLDLHMLRLGLNHQFGGHTLTGSREEGPANQAITFPTWEMHAQSTFVFQGYPSFAALYSGPNSLSPRPQAKETFTATAFVGFRLWQGGELYYNPELLQGFGLSETTGAGGFPNGEAQKSGFHYPRYNTSRLFLRQTFGLGGEQEDVEGEANQLSGKRDISRLTFQVGKFPVKDLFDGNAYSSDARVHFLNWSMWAAGAFDYPADKLGYTYGVTAEFNQKNWALRTGYFLIPDSSNSNNLDTALFRRGGYMAELETRYEFLSRPGKLRTTIWLNSAFSGDYRDAVELTATTGLDATDAIMVSRKGRIKYGYIFNLEQSLTDDVGLFGRWSWNDGRNEIMTFTDIDASLALGAAIKGKAWGRPDDTFGIGGVLNALSSDHRDYIAAGGLGILIGDGILNYRNERIFETYYALGLGKKATLAFDYQYLVNPAYNADRGPVHIFSGRLHAEM